MKKKIIIWSLIVALLLGISVGAFLHFDPFNWIGSNDTPSANTDATKADLEAALAYIKTAYKDVGEKTPRDFQRIGNVPVNGNKLEVVWSVNVGEEHVKVVKGENGIVTIDVNEQSTEDIKYVLTATVSNGTDSVSFSWNHLLPKATSIDEMVAIVDKAYQLQPGESFEDVVTLTGVITMVNTPWSEDYQNITVTIAVAGREDKPIECYRMKGDGAKDLMVGDTITVIGILKNYEGKIEFDAGCVLDAVIKGESVDAPTDVLQILKDAYALEEGKALPYVATLTGKITTINTVYNPAYGNVSVTIVIDGYPEYPILCYRIGGEGADSLLIGDTITVKGYICNYAGKIEFQQGSQLIAVEKTGTEIEAPTDTDDILDAAFGLAEGETLPYKATLTGKITKIKTPYDPGYKNVTVVMKVNGKTIEVYRLAGNGAEMIGINDTITVTGYLMNYHGTIQFAQGCTLDSWKDTGTDVPPEDENISSTTVVPEIVTSPKAGTAYKFFLYQKTLGKNLYLTGNMDGFYFETSADHTEAVDVFVEEVSGGYRLYVKKGGVKNYLEIVRVLSTDGKYHNNVVFTTKPTKVLKWNNAIKSFTCDLEIDGEKCDYYFGTYSSYQTMSGSDVTRVTGENAGAFDTENFVAHLATLKETKVSEEEKAFEELKSAYPATSNPTSVTESFTRRSVYTVEGKKIQVKWTTDNSAVKIVDNGNGTVTVKIARGDEAVNFKLTATITGDGETYTASWDYKIPAKPSENIPELPTTDGATITIEQALTYGAELSDYTTIKYKVTGKIVSVYNTTYGNLYIMDDAGRVLTIYGTYNADGTVRYDAMDVKPVAGDTITVYGSLGQYNGTAQIKNGWIVDHIVNTTPDEPKPEMSMQEIVDAAYDLAPGGMLMDQHTLTGVITSVDTPYSDQYGNVTVTIKVAGREDKPIKCYRLAGTGADKINVGDTITVTGMLKNYNGTIEFDQGCTLDSYVKGDAPEAPVDPTPTQPTTPSGGIMVPQVVTSPKTGTAYKFFLYQANKGTNLYLTGEMNGFYFATSENSADAIDVYVEQVTGGYRLYFLNGNTKNYVEIVRQFSESTGRYHNNVVFTTSPTKTLKWNAEIQSFTCDLDIDGTPADYYFGTYGTYNTISGSDVTRVTGDNAGTVGVSNFVAHLAVMKEVTVAPTEPTTPATRPTTPATQPTTPATTPTEPTPGAPTYELIGQPSVGVAYKWASDTGDAQGILTFVGTTANKDYYLSTSTTMSEGVDVYVEAVTGGYRMYFMAGTTKTYIDIYQSGSYVNAGLTTTPSAVYTWNSDFNTFVADIGGTPYYLGTYTNSSGTTHTTLSASKLSYMNPDNVNVTQYPVRFYAQTGAVDPQPTTPATQPTTPATQPTVAPTEPTVAPTEPTQAPTEEPTVAPTEPTPGMTMQEIVDAAYELASGAMMDGTQTLTGVITRVNTPYDSGYNNVTVTITVEGRDDKPIMCFRMKGDGADVIKVGDTITVTGTIKNYNGTIEFDAGCTLDSYTVGEAPEDPTEGMTMQELVDYAYQLPVGGYVDGKTLTGIITEVNNPFSSQYNNITVTIVVAGREDKPIECFRMKGEGADVIAVGDTITVTGSLTNYDGKIEFNSGCILDSYVKAETPTEPTTPVVPTEPTQAPTEEPTVVPTEPAPEKQLVDLTGTVVGACSGNAATANSYSEFTWWSDGRPDWKPLGNFVDNDLSTYFSFGASAGERSDLYLDLSKGGTGSTAVGEFTIYHGSQGDVPSIMVVLVLEDGTEWTKTYETNWAQFAGNLALTETFTENKNAVGMYIWQNGSDSAHFGDIEIYEYVTTSEPTEPTTPVVPTEPTEEPTQAPTEEPTQAPTEEPTVAPTEPVTSEVIIDFTDVANRDSINVNETNGSQVWKQNGITFTNDAGRVADYSNPVRCYANTAIKIEYTDMVKLVADCKTTIYRKVFVQAVEALNDSNITITEDGTTATLEFANPVDSLQITVTSQTRFVTITITGAAAGGETPTEPTTPVVPTEPTVAPTEPTVAPTEPTEAPTEEPTVAPTEPAAPAAGYNKITTLDELTTGKYVLVVSNGKAPTVLDGTWVAAGTPTIDGDTISVENAAGYIWDITVNGTSVTLTDANGVTIKPKSGNTNGIQSGTYNWAVSCSNGTFQFKGTGSDTTTFTFNGDSQYLKFRSYKNTTVSGNTSTYLSTFTLYKLSEGTVAPEEPTTPPTEAPTEAPTTAPTEPETEMTMVEIVDAAYELTSGTAMDGTYTLTGVITRVNTPYDSGYSNVTVTITVEGREDKPIMCYRLKGDGADQIAVGDTITVTGSIKNYNGTIEFDQGCTLDSYVKGVAPEDPYAGMTMQELVDAAYALEVGGYIDGKTLTGKITAVNSAYSDQYKNVTVTIVVEGKEDKPIECFRMKGNGADVIGVGDTITVTGSLTNYDGKIEFNSGCTLDSYTKAQNGGELDPSDINYVYGSYGSYNNVIKNWGERGVVATGLSPNAKAFYTTNNTSYAQLAALSGSATVSSVPSSALYAELQDLMVENHSTQTSYGDTRYLYCFTDCENSDSSSISCFYSGDAIGPNWDSGSTWNREHCWPKSKTPAGDANNGSTGEVGDIMTLRPTKASLNSSRGNKAYGQSSSYYNPNGNLGSTGYDLRGDVARIVLYNYVRWDDAANMWGTSGVMESKEVLLDWIEADPVDTWELGRNDSVESITGTRNVFVDYPELAFVLFGEEVPATMQTPSKAAA